MFNLCELDIYKHLICLFQCSALVNHNYLRLVKIYTSYVNSFVVPEKCVDSTNNSNDLGWYSESSIKFAINFAIKSRI